MTSDKTLALIEANAEILGLDIRPEWMPNVLRFVEIARGMAELSQAGGVLEASESAPIFTLRDVE